MMHGPWRNDASWGRIGHAAGLVAFFAVLGVLTLAPSSATVEPVGVLCLICGSRGSADALLNILLFVPFGWLVARRWGVAAAMVAGLSASATVEVLQALIPGRYPTLGDLVFNSVGAGLGAVVRLGRLPVGVVRVLALVALVAPLALAAPRPQEGLYYGQWTVDFDDLEVYDGRVLEARVDGIAVPPGPSERSADLRTALARGRAIGVVVVAGSRPTSLAPVFSMYDDRQREILLVGVDGVDVVVRRRQVATAVRVSEPVLRANGAMAGVLEGDTVRLGFEHRDGGVCAVVDAVAHCGLEPGLEDGWRFVLPGGLIPDRAGGAFSVIWMLGLGAAAVWAGGSRDVVAALAVMAGGLVAASQLPWVSAGPIGVAAWVAGVGSALALRRPPRSDPAVALEVRR